MQGEVREITDLAQWDKFVEESPQGSIFCTGAWMSFSFKPKIYGYFKNDTLLGGICGFETYTSVSSEEFGLLDATGFYSGYKTPLTPFLGIICRSLLTRVHKTATSEQVEITDALIKYLNRYEVIGISNHYNLQDIRPFIWDGFKQEVKYTYLVQELWLDLYLEKDTRYLVHRFERDGFVVSKEAPENFWDIYCATFARKGLPLPITEAMYQSLTRKIPNDVFICRKDGVITSGAVMIYDKKRAYYILGGSDGGGSSSLTVFTALTEAFKKVQEVDLVGCNNRDIALFKRGFGGELKPYYAVSKGL